VSQDMNEWKVSQYGGKKRTFTVVRDVTEARRGHVPCDPELVLASFMFEQIFVMISLPALLRKLCALAYH
jgi:hypothetical protein